MLVFRAKLRKVGNSFGVLVPADVVRDVGGQEGTEVEVLVGPPPEGRADALRRLVGSEPGLPPFTRERQDRY